MLYRRIFRRWMGCLLLLGPIAVQGQTPAGTSVAGVKLALACMSCHGPDGRAEGVGYAIAKRPSEQILGDLLKFKLGLRAGTVMPTIAKAFSDEELRTVAVYFSNVK